MWSAIFSTGWSRAKDRRPRPSSPALTALVSEAAACQQGGCGSWNGLGVCIRSGNTRFSLFQEKRSSSHMRTTISTASRHWARDRSSAGTPKAVCSIGVDRPVPHSTRPCERTSTVATFSATRAGWMKPKGMRVTPNPSLICSVDRARPPRMASEQGEAERPSRKWCSTTQTVLNPSLSAYWISAMASS